jgi:ribonuclease P protein component
MNFKLPKRLKILKTDDFSSVFSFRKRVAGPYLIIQYQPNSLGFTRMGLVVGKKLSSLAVDRNYMKRVLRELFRTHPLESVSLDLVVRPQKPFSPINYSEIAQEFVMLLDKLSRQHKA